MVAYLTLDSSVIVAALREHEEKHEVCKRLLERVKNGEFIALESYTVLVEVVAAIKRRTGSEHLAERVKSGLENIDNINFLDLISIRADDAADISKETGVGDGCNCYSNRKGIRQPTGEFGYGDD